MLQGDDDTNTAFRDVVANPIDDDDDDEEVKVTIMRVKNNKAADPDGLTAELFKSGCKELVGRLHQPIYKLRLEKSMPNE